MIKHPDRELVANLVEGVQEGFRVGFDYSKCTCKSAIGNTKSALEHPEVVSNYLAEECSRDRVLGPFSSADLPEVHVSRFGVIPKGKSEKWCLIVDLSAPEGKSVNDGIDPSLCSLTYVTVNNAVSAILRTGKGSFIAKADIKQAYRMVPVHPQDRPLLGVLWQGSQSSFVDSEIAVSQSLQRAWSTHYKRAGCP